MQKSKCDSRLVFLQAYMWLRNRLAVSRYWTQRSKSNFSSTCGKVYWASSTKPFNILKFVCTSPCLHARLCKFQQCIFFSLWQFSYSDCVQKLTAIVLYFLLICESLALLVQWITFFYLPGKLLYSQRLIKLFYIIVLKPNISWKLFDFLTC